MKIAILTSGILPVPAVQGGAVENLIDFYLEYNEQHRLHDITVYSVSHPDAKSHPALRSTVNHYQLIDTTSLMAKTRRYIYKKRHGAEYYNHFVEYYFEQAYQHLSRQAYDLIILENRPGYAYKLSQRVSTPIVLHLHNDLLNAETPHHQEIFDHLTSILTVSKYIQSRVSTIAASPKISPVYNGIDLQGFSQSSRSAISRSAVGFSEHDFVLVFSGRINRDKGIAELIDAMLLLKDLPHVKLMIIGSTFFGNADNENGFVRELKQKAADIKERLIFTGFIPYNQMPDYLRMADIAVIPSVWDDPFPTTVLEAQAMGLPVIASNRGGIPEEVGEGNAIIVPTEDHYVARLADAIRQLHDHPEQRAEMGRISLQHSRQFAKERFAADFFHAIESVQ